MPLTEEIIAQSVERYWREMDRYAKLAVFVADKCRDMVDAKLIRATVTSRVKEPERLRGKLRKQLKKSEEHCDIDSVEAVFTHVVDLAGVRITTYVERDRARVVEELKKIFVGKIEGEGVVVEEKDAPDKLYRATHCQVYIPEEELVGTYVNMKGLSCEVQVCSLLAHVYNEIEHDIRYKQLTGDISEKEHDLLNALGKLAASGDVLVETVLEAQERRQKNKQGEFEDEYDFVARMRDRFPEADRFPEHAYQLFEELQAFGLDSPESIENGLLNGDYRNRAEELVTKLGEYCDREKGLTLLVEPDTSDRLLVLLLEKHASEIEQRHPAGRGRGRPARIRSLATRFLRMTLEQEEHAIEG